MNHSTFPRTGQEEIRPDPKENRFAAVPNTVVFDSRLSDAAKTLYSGLLLLCGRSMTCIHTNGWIAKAFGKSGVSGAKWVQRHLGELIQSGVVESKTDPEVPSGRVITVLVYRDSESQKNVDKRPPTERKTPGQICPTPRTELSTPLDKNVQPPGQICPTPPDRIVHQY